MSASAPNPCDLPAIGASKDAAISDVAVEKEMQSVLPSAIEGELIQINQPRTLANYL
jgi:hypothetical protein